MKKDMTFEEALRFLADRCTRLEAALLAQTSINKLLVQTIANSGENDPDRVRAFLHDIADQNPDPEISQSLATMAEHIRDPHQPSREKSPALRLVPSPPQGSEKENPDPKKD